MRREIYELKFCWLEDFFKQVARTAVSIGYYHFLLTWLAAGCKHKVKVRAIDLHIIGGLRTSGFVKFPKLVAWGLLEAFLCPSTIPI